jgi:hypothetical protein
VRWSLVSAALIGVACHSDGDPVEDCPAVPTLSTADLAAGMCVTKDLSWVEDRQAATDRMAALGARVIRSDLRWLLVQPTEDTWDWSVPDAAIDAAEASGLEYIAMVGYGVPWASSQTDDDSYYPPDDVADFATFAGAAAERYAGRIGLYEIWNEPNAGYRFWKPDLAGDPVAYGELFLAAEAAIHAVDPGARVILGGTFFHEQAIPGTITFTAEMLQAWPEILERADGVAVHPYTQYPPRVPPEEDQDGEIPVWEMYAQLRSLTGDLPVHVTEMGWPSWDPVDEDEQAAWLTRGMLLSQAEGITDLCWYTLYDDEEPVYQEDSFGLTRWDETWKPSGEAFAALAERAAQATGVGRVEDLPDGAWGVSYGDAGTAYWGEGQVCGETLGDAPVWVDP